MVGVGFTGMVQMYLSGMEDVFAREEVAALKTQVKSAKSVVVTSHRSPDGDAVGSSLALKHMLSAMGVSSTVVMPDAYAKFLHWMPGQATVRFHDVVDRSAQRSKLRVVPAGVVAARARMLVRDVDDAVVRRASSRASVAEVVEVYRAVRPSRALRGDSRGEGPRSTERLPRARCRQRVSPDGADAREPREVALVGHEREDPREDVVGEAREERRRVGVRGRGSGRDRRRHQV